MNSTPNELQSPAHEAKAVDKPQITQSGRSLRKRKPMKQVGGSNRQRAPKKLAATARTRAYEFERLSDVCEAADGRILYKVEWKATWIHIEYLDGPPALEEAKKLIMQNFDHSVWQGEIHKCHRSNVTSQLISMDAFEMSSDFGCNYNGRDIDTVDG